MIECYTVEADKKVAPIVASTQLNALTLERNAVLIARVSKDSGYDFPTLQALKSSLEHAFPNHTVFVWYDDIEFMTVQDKGYPVPNLEGLNATSNYY